jgi:hypothetical protein
MLDRDMVIGLRDIDFSGIQFHTILNLRNRQSSGAIQNRCEITCDPGRHVRGDNTGASRLRGSPAITMIFPLAIQFTRSRRDAKPARTARHRFPEARAALGPSAGVDLVMNFTGLLCRFTAKERPGESPRAHETEPHGGFGSAQLVGDFAGREAVKLV